MTNQVAVQGYPVSLDMTDEDIEAYKKAKWESMGPPVSAITYNVTNARLPLFETKQLPIDEASKKVLIEARQLIFNDDVAKLASQVYTGEITIGKWEESMKSAIRGLYTSVATIQRGGWDQMTWSDWGKMGAPLKEQYKYLHEFAKSIEANRETVSLNAITSRAKMYGNAASHTADIVNISKDIVSKLPWMPRDGSTECLVNCKCRWELKVLSKTKQFQMVQAVWMLSPAEHCNTCIDRRGHTETIYVGKDVEVPPVIGYH